MSADLFNKLKALGLSMEQVGGVLEIIDAREGAMKAAEEARKAAGRERVQRWREKNKPSVTLQKHIGNATVPLTSASDAPATEENKQTNKPERKQDTAPLALEFDETFWPAYPLKRGKADALKAFLAARKRASLEIIIAGVRRYASERAGEDPKFTKHAQGWLSGDHWTDEPVPRRQPQQAHAPPETVGSLSRKQLFGPRNEIDATDYSERRMEASGPRRLEAGAGASRSFTVPSDILGSF